MSTIEASLHARTTINLVENYKCTNSTSLHSCLSLSAMFLAVVVLLMLYVVLYHVFKKNIL